MQRKPSERLGLRGATEVKDHAWVKYYPWKDLYEKKIEPGFIPKAGADHWDKKYCEAPDKMGVETKERYEKHLRSETTHEAFKNYYYFSNGQDTPDVFVQGGGGVTVRESLAISRSSENPNSSYRGEKKLNPSLSSSSINKESNSTLEHSGSATKMRVLEKTNSIDSRISKLKKIAVSSSNSSLLRNYKQQSSNINMSNNSTGNSSTSSLQFGKQRSSSQVNLNNNKY